MTRVPRTGRPDRRRQQRIDEAATFLQSIWSDTPDTVGVLAYKKPSARGLQAVSFASGDTRRAAAKAIQLSDNGCDVYTHLALTDEEPAPGRRLTASSVTALNCVWAELDYGADGHRIQAGPADPDLARQVIDSFPLPPSIVVSSGNGFHCYWTLEKTLAIGNDQEEHEAAELLRCFGRSWQEHATSAGYKAESVFDLPTPHPPSPRHPEPQGPKPAQGRAHRTPRTQDLHPRRHRARQRP